MPRRRDGALEVDGWHFKRGEGGTVTIWAGDSNGGGHGGTGPEITLTPVEWARIVAAVSALPNCFRSALALHQGDA